ncbi:MAG: hypothetical protein JNJ64_10535 [Flavobacteriales bacterium]|nr:hypothetical protein [Flavobacteriales bacterium]
MTSILRSPLRPALAALCVLGCGFAHAQAWTFTGDATPTWEQVIDRYRALAEGRRSARLMEIGRDDGGQPIHLFVISDGGPFAPDSIRARGRSVLFIINGIHPGEPDGIDASLLLARALLDSDQLMGLTATTAVCIVPIYNVSGAQQRDTIFRVDQNGPAVHGQRANARNLDLNRDLVKADARNTQALVQALHRWDPDVLIDTHVSDGADHRYVMELLTTRREKLDPAVAGFMDEVLVPGLQRWMDRKDIAMCPYFETMAQVPDSGLMAFFDGPRYTSGYAALFNTVALLAESHMLKPYADRVNATFQLLLGVLSVLDEHGAELRRARAEAARHTAEATGFPLHWRLDSTRVERLPWKGYAAVREPSKVSGLPRLRYDRSRPVDTTVPWYDTYVPGPLRTKPAAYLVPQAWREVGQRLAMAGVRFERIMRDTVLRTEVHRIVDLRTAREPYEGHHLHRDIRTSIAVEEVTARAGDLLVPLGTRHDRFLLEVLEPDAPDSYFAWGFFDAILQQKEWFTDYVFEDVAADLLARDPALRAALEERRAADPAFADDAWAQLVFVFQRSPYMEPAYRRYPVVRVLR